MYLEKLDWILYIYGFFILLYCHVLHSKLRQCYTASLRCCEHLLCGLERSHRELWFDRSKGSCVALAYGFSPSSSTRNSIGTLGDPLETFKIPHKCSHTMGWTINPFANIDFSSVRISSVASFFLGCSVSFVDHIWGSVNKWLGCGLPMTTHPSFIMPQWHGLLHLNIQASVYIILCPFGALYFSNLCLFNHSLKWIEQFIKTMLLLLLLLLSSSSSSLGCLQVWTSPLQ